MEESIDFSMQILSIAVRPQSVEILRKETYLTEGKKVHIVCEVNHSLPNENYLIAKQKII